MVHKGLKALCALSTFIALAACSSLLEGTSQEIAVNTNPPGADCVLMREGISVARVAPTPGAATIKKTKRDVTIKCDKQGFHTATFINKSDVAGATGANVVMGVFGAVGWAIDSASGADNKYTSPVNVTLVPDNMAAPAPAYSVPPASMAPAQESKSPGS